MILLHEHFADDGAAERTTLTLEGSDLRIALERGGALREAHLVPPELVRGIFRRYGKPLDEGTKPLAPALRLSDGSSLAALRHLARFDVVARDWLVWSALGEEPLAELSTSVSAALWHLVRARAAAE